MNTKHTIARGVLLLISLVILYSLISLYLLESSVFHNRILELFPRVFSRSLEYSIFIKSLLQIFGALVFIGITLMLFFVKRVFIVINLSKKYLKNQTKRFIKFYKSEGSAFLLLFFVFILIQFVNVFYRLFTFDEQSTYIYLVQFGPLSVLTDYYPNNHLLFNFIFSILSLSNIEPVICGRLISLFFFILGTCIMYYLMRKLFKKWLCLLSFSLFLFSYPSLLYAASARGYAFIIICFSIQFLIVLIWSKKGLTKTRYFAFVITGVCGFASVLSYLYAFFIIGLWALFLFIVNKSQKNILNLISASIFVGLGSVIAYSPIILISGVNRIVNNDFVKPLAYSEVLNGLPKHINSTFLYLTGIMDSEYSFLFLIAIVIGFFLMFALVKKEISKEDNEVLFFLTVSLIAIPFIIFIHKVLPYERTWSFLIFPITTAFGILIFHSFNGKIRPIFIISIVSFLTILSVFKFNNHFYFELGPEKLKEKLINTKVDLSQIESYFSEDIVSDIKILYLLNRYKNDTVNIEKSKLQLGKTQIITLKASNPLISQIKKSSLYTLLQEDEKSSTFILNTNLP
tara:strand:- start:838 stop:2550 length:1713 start_codon:yes stop_codon:yes gene_type:complete